MTIPRSPFLDGGNGCSRGRGLFAQSALFTEISRASGSQTALELEGKNRSTEIPPFTLSMNMIDQTNGIFSSSGTWFSRSSHYESQECSPNDILSEVSHSGSVTWHHAC